MSRSYRMSVEVKGVNVKYVNDVEDALMEEWDWSDGWDRYNASTVVSTCNTGDSQLCGGETEEEFADRVAAAAWKANRGYCEVSVGALLLEEVGELHDRSENAFDKFMVGKAHCVGCQAIVTKSVSEEHDGKFYCSDCWDERLRSTK